MNFPQTVVAVFTLTFVWLYITRISYADFLPHSPHKSSHRWIYVRAPRPLLKTSELSEKISSGTDSFGEELRLESKQKSQPRTPSILYGTAWKEARTEELVGKALTAGYYAIDTANQGKHYNETGVGAAVSKATRAGLVSRQQLWLQTKFTHANAQDLATIPYDPNLTPTQQVLLLPKLQSVLLTYTKCPRPTVIKPEGPARR